MQKKARIYFGEKEVIIDITDDLDYRNRIINELACMALERCPMLNPKEELKDVPFIYWPKDALNDAEEDKIQEIIEERENEFNDLLEPLALKGLKLKLRPREYVWFGDSYNVSEDDKIKGICINIEINLGRTDKKGKIIWDYKR